MCAHYNVVLLEKKKKKKGRVSSISTVVWQKILLSVYAELFQMCCRR